MRLVSLYSQYFEIGRINAIDVCVYSSLTNITRKVQIIIRFKNLFNLIICELIMFIFISIQINYF